MTMLGVTPDQFLEKIESLRKQIEILLGCVEVIEKTTVVEGIFPNHEFRLRRIRSECKETLAEIKEMG